MLSNFEEQTAFCKGELKLLAPLDELGTAVILKSNDLGVIKSD